MSGEDKIDNIQDNRDMDIADFAEEYLGCHLFWFQKQMLRELYKNRKVLYSRAFPHSGFRYCIFLKDYLDDIKGETI